MPLAHAIYGQSSSNHNRNYRGSKSKHAEAKVNLQSKRSAAGPPSSGNIYVPTTHNSVDHQRMQAFKNNMKEI